MVGQSTLEIPWRYGSTGVECQQGRECRLLTLQRFVMLLQTGRMLKNKKISVNSVPAATVFTRPGRLLDFGNRQPGHSVGKNAIMKSTLLTEQSN